MTKSELIIVKALGVLDDNASSSLYHGKREYFKGVIRTVLDIYPTLDVDKYRDEWNKIYTKHIKWCETHSCVCCGLENALMEIN